MAIDHTGDSCLDKIIEAMEMAYASDCHLSHVA